MTDEIDKVAPPGGGFHVIPSKIVEPTPQYNSPEEPNEEIDPGDCDACDRK